MSCHFFRLLEGFGGVLVRLLRKLMSGEVIAFAVSGGGGIVSVGGFVVVFGCAVVWTLRHDVLLASF
jgi:hypothetical protein